MIETNRRSLKELKCWGGEMMHSENGEIYHYCKWMEHNGGVKEMGILK